MPDTLSPQVTLRPAVLAASALRSGPVLLLPGLVRSSECGYDMQPEITEGNRMMYRCAPRHCGRHRIGRLYADVAVWRAFCRAGRWRPCGYDNTAFRRGMIDRHLLSIYLDPDAEQPVALLCWRDPRPRPSPLARNIATAA